MTSIKAHVRYEMLGVNSRAFTLGGRLCMAVARFIGHPGVRLGRMRMTIAVNGVTTETEYDVVSDGRSITLDPGRYADQFREGLPEGWECVPVFPRS